MRRTILIVIIVVELADASCALWQLGAGTVGVANTVDFLTVTIEVLITGASSIHHRLANSAALGWDVVVIEFLRGDGANGNQADKQKAVLILHSFVERMGSVDMFARIRDCLFSVVDI